MLVLGALPVLTFIPPKDFEQKLLSYQRYITKLKKTGNFLMGQFANADETAIYLHMPPNQTEKKGIKESTLENHWMRKASLNSDAGTNC
jgi:hypothetical protein